MLNLIRNSAHYFFSALSIALLCISYARAETQFFDDFNGVAVDQSIWTFPTGAASFNGQTQMRPSYPSVSNSLLHLQLDTYNPTGNPVGNSFLGSEILTRGTATPGTGLIAEIRARMVTPVNGLVGGAFLFITIFPQRIIARLIISCLATCLIRYKPIFTPVNRLALVTRSMTI